MGEKRATEVEAVGVVTGHTPRPTHDRKGMLPFPSVRFQTADGRTVEFQNKIGTNAPPRVGEEVTVCYDPERPEDAKVALASTFRINPKAWRFPRRRANVTRRQRRSRRWAGDRHRRP